MKIAERDDEREGGEPVWDLQDLFASKEAPALAAALLTVEKEAHAFAVKYQGKVSALSGQQLATAIDAYEKIEQQAARIQAFITLTVSADRRESGWGQTLSEQLEPAMQQLLFFRSEIGRMKETEILDKVSEPALARYSPWIRQIRGGRPHQLDEALEKYMHEKHAVAEEAWMRLYDMMRASTADNESTDALESDDSTKRRETFIARSRARHQDKKTFALVLNTLVDLKAMEDTKRGFKNPEDSRHLSNQVEPEVINMMVKTVRDSYPRLAHRYYAWKAKKLGVAQLHPADRAAPLPGPVPHRISWNEAKDIVLRAYHNFSPEMGEIAGKFFDRQWIDAESRAHKAGGAFTHPGGAHSYIHLNYKGRARDVRSLAHELGHGIHQTLRAPQGHLKSATPLMLAETASIFGETLAFHDRLAHEEDLVARRALLAGRVEDMLNSVVRQTAIYTFEQRLHQECRAKNEISPARITEIWQETQKESLGSAINLNAPGAENLWMEVPHFVHNPFYTYAYAFGSCAANALYQEYTKSPDKPEFVRKYTEFLKAGGTVTPEAALAAFGIDVKSPQFWKKQVAAIEGYIDEVIALDLKIEALQKTQKDFKDTSRDILLPPSPPPAAPGRKHSGGPIL